MSPFARHFLICAAAYAIGIAGAVLAILGLVDINTLSLDSGLPTVAMTTPMLAVVIFWAVARILGANISAARTFLFGGIAVYSLLYLCGRLVANGLFSDGTATLIGALSLFFVAFWATNADQEQNR